MADLRARPGELGDAGGFTLVEMLAALGILLFGVTALVGSLSSSIAGRRTSEAKLQMSAIADQVVLQLQEQAIVDDPETGLPRFLPQQDQPVPGFPGMTWSASAVADPLRPDVWLVRIDVAWPGSEVLEVPEDGAVGGGGDLLRFWRVLPRQLPLRERVVAFRAGANEDSPR